MLSSPSWSTKSSPPSSSVSRVSAAPAVRSACGGVTRNPPCGLLTRMKGQKCNPTLGAIIGAILVERGLPEMIGVQTIKNDRDEVTIAVAEFLKRDYVKSAKHEYRGTDATLHCLAGAAEEFKTKMCGEKLFDCLKQILVGAENQKCFARLLGVDQNIPSLAPV